MIMVWAVSFTFHTAYEIIYIYTCLYIWLIFVYDFHIIPMDKCNNRSYPRFIFYMILGKVYSYLENN